MTYIKKISMSGFKSFGDRTVTVKLSSGFTCIVGPNGAGKSNIIDALCFALGRLSKKTMRAKSLEDLIFAGSKGKNPANRAMVTLHFDNSESVFPGGANGDFTISRTIKRGGGGGYKMNGKKATRQQILNALATANIDPDGTNQFVLQGKIVELTHMNSEDRRRFIEELIGLQKYDEMKDATLKELEKAERDLGQFEAIFNEVSAQLRKVEKEKNDALAWRELDDQISHYNAQLISLKISKLQKEEEELDKKLEESGKVIEELQEKVARQEDTLRQESLVMENIQKTITEKEKEREEINEDITQLKTQLSSNQTTLDLAEKSIEKLRLEKENLENLLMTLEEGQNFDSQIEIVTIEISEKETQIEDAKQDIEKRQQNQAELDIKIKNSEDEKSHFKSEISKVKQQISSNKAQIKLLRENIKKNKDKKKNLEAELNRLKGEAESVEDAVEATKKIESEIRKRIEDLKNKISEENKRQMNIENSISSILKVKSDLNSKLSSLQATLSSLNTEIKMNKETIAELNKKKADIEEKIKELSKGKETEEVIKELIKKKENLIKKITDLKTKSKNEDSIYRENEQNFELLKLKQNSIESEIIDNKGKISNINTELKIFKKELMNLEREKRNLDLIITDMTASISKTGKEIENFNIKKENIQGRLNELSKEKENLLNRIENTEEEYEENKKDITGILQILNMLTQNIDVSVDSIKGSIQQSNAEAINTSAEDFRKFVLDIVDIMKTLEGVGCDADEISEMTDMLNSIVQTLGIFTENADATIEQLINKVRDSADIAVQSSTSNFDSFVQDLTDILENIHLSLRKLTLSKSQELYKQLEEISNNIKSQDDDLNDIEKKLTVVSSQNKHDSEKLSASNRRLEEVYKRMKDLNLKETKYKKEIEERNKKIKERQENYDDLNNEVNKLKEIKDRYWDNISEIQNESDRIQIELNNNQEKLQELQGIQSLFENIIDIDNLMLELNNTIEEKKKLIIDTGAKIDELQQEAESLQKKIETLTSDKEKFWETTEDIQIKIDEENKKLEETVDNLRGLDNIMRIIHSIEELKNENVEANKSIELSKKNMDNYNSEVDKIQKNVDDKQKIIDTLRDEKAEELEDQKKAQNKLNKLNKNLQKTQAKLNELNKNKEREQQIIKIGENIKETENQTEILIKEIGKLDENLENEIKKKDAKQAEMDEFIKEKDESWKKQKQYQNIITDLKSDLSMENSKINNFESKKFICIDQIETLYERSKDYGTLPPVSDEITEESLQSDIEIATKKKKALEPVNLKAIEQYDVIKERFDEIDMRRQTIQRERKAILDSIDKIELEKTRTFMKAYHEINREFSRIFQKLSPGGSAKMILDRPDKPFEGGISIEARPRGKKISSLEILSGGEKTLVALSFIFAVQEFYPAPFYVMDEIDAALDGPNVHRCSTVIKEFSRQAQFMVISHREENIVNADRIYGVSMPQSGITDIFSVDLEEEAKRLLELEDVVPEVGEG
ncbi:MAG: AAA family ATPase [Candidatus Thorarchaeota archaeon]